MLRHACGFKMANDGVDTRTIQAYLGHKDIRHTVRYTELSPCVSRGCGRTDGVDRSDLRMARTMRLVIEVAILAATGLVVWITVHGLLGPTEIEHEVLVALAFVLWIAGWLVGRVYILRRRARFRRRLSPPS
jgi:hypothetical protein